MDTWVQAEWIIQHSFMIYNQAVKSNMQQGTGFIHTASHVITLWWKGMLSCGIRRQQKIEPSKCIAASLSREKAMCCPVSPWKVDFVTQTDEVWRDST